MADEPDNLVLQLLREIRVEQAQTNDRIDGLGRAVGADIHELDAKIDATRKDLSDQIVGLRRAVVEYHSAVIGHGTIIADLEARRRRVEQSLGLESL
jgi:signal transduction histidine kinase